MSAALAPKYWGGHLVALVLCGIAGQLGLWQFESWQERREAEAIDLTETAPEPLVDVLGPDDPFPADQVGQPVTASGTWVPAGTVYVSGREHDGVDGYWVVTPLAIGSPDGPALPVVRGWVADPEDAPAAAEGPGEVTVWLQPTEGTNVADDDRTDDILPQVRTADLIQHVDQDLYGAFGVSTEPLDGLEAASLEQLPEVGAFTALRNFLYGVEWWVFGGFVIFIWWRWVRDITRPTAVTNAAEDRENDPVASKS